MKKYEILYQITNFIRSHHEGYQFSTKLISEILEIPENQVRRCMLILKQTGYIHQINSDQHYRIYIATPKLINRNIRMKTILKKYKTLTQIQKKEYLESSEKIHEEIKEQTKRIQELKYLINDLKDQITKNEKSSPNHSQRALF